jgi:predicted nucleotidyltransferase
VITEEEIVAAVRRYPEIHFAFLFGSRCGPSPRPHSDWDVAVYVDPVRDEKHRFALRQALAGELAGTDRLDVVILNDAPPLLAHRALTGRSILMQNRSSHVRFFVRTLAASFDEQHWRDLHARARAGRLKEGRFGRP